MAEKTSVLDCITSFVDGRVRLRHPALKDAATAELVCTVVREVEGITAVESNPRTGSLLIFYDPAKLSREELLGLAEQASAFLPDPEAEEVEAVEAPAEAPAEKPAVAAEGAESPADGLSSAVSKLAELVEGNEGKGKGQGGKSGKGGAGKSGKSGGAGSGKGGGSGRGKGGGGAGGGGRGGKSGGASALGILSTVVSTALPGKLPKAIIGGLATTLPKVLNKGFATEASATVSQALPEESGFPRTADELLDMLTSRKATRFVNRGMLVALGVSLAALPLNNKTLHTIAGGVFAGGVLQHLLAHRKAL